jgi:hypothetical protein
VRVQDAGDGGQDAARHEAADAVAWPQWRQRSKPWNLGFWVGRQGLRVWGWGSSAPEKRRLPEGGLEGWSGPCRRREAAGLAPSLPVDARQRFWGLGGWERAVDRRWGRPRRVERRQGCEVGGGRRRSDTRGRRKKLEKEEEESCAASRLTAALSGVKAPHRRLTS